MPSNDPFDDGVTNPSWSELAAQTFQVEFGVGKVVLTGPCPRCGDPMTYPWRTDVFLLNHDPGIDARPIPMVCLCKSKNHAGAPDKVEGCGAIWDVKLNG